MILWNVPDDIEIGVIPKRIFCNKDLIVPLKTAFINLIVRGYAERELLTWDGCFNIRQTTGGVTYSLHSWGIAIDVNAFANPYGAEPAMSKGFVECFTDAGFDWGGDWRIIKDGMHFQLKHI